MVFNYGINRMMHKAPFWNNRDLSKLENCSIRIPEMLTEDVQRRLLNRDYNEITFYDITPKENLPKYLQKLNFQSVHIKESKFESDSEETEKNVRIFKKEKKEPEEIKARQALKDSGNILYLSEM